MGVRGDESSYARAVRLAHGAALAPHDWPGALEALADYVGGAGGMLVAHDFDEHQNWIIGGRLDPARSQLYITRYADNPHSREALRRGPGLYVTHEITDMRAVKRTEFGADILIPDRIESICQLVHPAITTGGASGGFGVTLSQRHMADVEGARRRLRRISTQLRLAADLYLARSERAHMVEARMRMLDLLEEPALLASSAHVVRGANRPAEALLADGSVFTTARGLQLQCRDAHDGARLRLAVSTAALHGAATSLRLYNPEGWLAVIAPAPEPARDGRVIGPGLALIRLIDPHADLGKRAQTAARLFDLSPSEKAVLAQIARGQSAPDAASILGLSAETVRTHLKHIFDKANVRSQVELAQLVARLPGTSGEA